MAFQSFLFLEADITSHHHWDDTKPSRITVTLGGVRADDHSGCSQLGARMPTDASSQGLRQQLTITGSLPTTKSRRHQDFDVYSREITKPSPIACYVYSAHLRTSIFALSSFVARCRRLPQSPMAIEELNSTGIQEVFQKRIFEPGGMFG